jgi:hypothetical protein
LTKEDDEEEDTDFDVPEELIDNEKNKKLMPLKFPILQKI